MGAVGALVLAIARRRLSFSLLRQALNSTAKLSTFVLFVLIGSTIFSLTFQGIDGPKWVEHLFTSLPGGQIGFLIVVNVLIFLLGCFIDFFEIAFILLPLIGPVADKLGIDLIWFGIIVGMNLQTSFLTPPFGFALFYLRSVAPSEDYDDRVTGKRIAKVTTADIYKGSVAFVAIQLVMLVIVIAFPSLTLDALGERKKLDTEGVTMEIPSDAGAAGDADASRPEGQGEAGDKQEAGPADDPFKIKESSDESKDEGDLGASLFKPVEEGKVDAGKAGTGN
jgi:TRAP-type mannitol/chloroaromatic compound transport system permease large subunit